MRLSNTKAFSILLILFSTGLWTRSWGQSRSANFNFEDGSLVSWIGKPGQNHSATITVDPLNPTNHVLSFTNLNQNGDIFTANSFPGTGAMVSVEKVMLSFDFLGTGNTPNNGGFCGLYVSDNQYYWVAGTEPTGLTLPPSPHVLLSPDGVWHHYDIDLTALIRQEGISQFRLMFEDWSGAGSGISGGVPGDVFFDNIQLMYHPGVSIRVSQIEVCWDTATNLVYEVQYKPAMTTNNPWQTFGPEITGTGSRLCVFDNVPVTEPRRFYRVVSKQHQ
jgi:hypothetical protein